MKKKAYIIHGWDGYPEEGWFLWLKSELEQKGFSVKVPQMPNQAEPKIEEWVSHISQIVGNVDENTYLIGHSIGCQAILRYLELLENARIGGVVFVAGWFTLKGISDYEELEIARPWLETPINFDKVRKKTDNFFAIFSDDDYFVPIENETLFIEQIGAKTAIEPNKGHFSGEDKVKEIPMIPAIIEKWQNQR